MTSVAPTFELALPSQKWARHIAGALADAGWGSRVVALDADHVRAHRPNLAALLPPDLLVCWVVLAAPPAGAQLEPGWTALIAGGCCSRCGGDLDAALIVALDGHPVCAGCLTREEAACVADTPDDDLADRDDWPGDAP